MPLKTPFRAFNVRDGVGSYATGVKQHFRSITAYNIRTMRQQPLAELSGALGDLGTLLPLMIAMTLTNSINLDVTLVFSGLANIITGLLFGIPLPVQPMKAIAATAIAETFNRKQTAVAGIVVASVVLALSLTGLLRLLHRVVPVPVVKGIQVGAGLSLVLNAGTNFILKVEWDEPWYDNRIWAIAAFVFLIISTLVPRIPYALIVFMLGLFMVVAVHIPHMAGDYHSGWWNPWVDPPRKLAWDTGTVAAIPQIPLTTLNSILAVTSLSATLFPEYPSPPSTTSLGLSVAAFNLTGCWFGMMPICHGSGGLAAQYRFGARSGASIVILGVVKVILGLFFGNGIIPVLHHFPKSFLGIMVLAAGVELAKVGQTVFQDHDLWERAENDSGDGHAEYKPKPELEQDSQNRWMVMLITAACCIAFKNDAVGFLAGLTWHWALQVPRWVPSIRRGFESARLRFESSEQGQGLLSSPR